MNDKPQSRFYRAVNFNARSRIRISPRIFKNPAFHIQAQWNGFCIQIKVLGYLLLRLQGQRAALYRVGCFNGISLAMVLAVTPSIGSTPPFQTATMISSCRGVYSSGFQANGVGHCWEGHLLTALPPPTCRAVRLQPGSKAGHLYFTGGSSGAFRTR